MIEHIYLKYEIKIKSKVAISESIREMRNSFILSDEVRPYPPDHSCCVSLIE